MLLAVVLPELAPGMTYATVHTVHCVDDDELTRGGKLFDIKVDLSAVFEHDCAPVSYYRLAAGSRLWVRKVSARLGDTVRAGEMLALCSTTPDESLDEAPHQQVRLSVIAILGQADIWT